jgi:hypothetical protein
MFNVQQQQQKSDLKQQQQNKNVGNSNNKIRTFETATTNKNYLKQQQ